MGQVESENVGSADGATWQIFIGGNVSEPQLATIDTQPLELGLISLRREAMALGEVTDQTAYIRACQIAKAARDYKKDVHSKLDPFVNFARNALEKARDEMNKYLRQADEIAELASTPAARWKEEERRKAAAEEERINAERRREATRIAEEERREAERKAEADRKERERQIAEARKAGELNKREADRLAKQAAEDARQARELAAKQAGEAAANVQEVRVKPSVPTVSGVRARVVWDFRVVDESKLPRKYLKADEVAIGQEVRRLKNKEAAEAAIPGIEVTAEDRV